MVKTTLHSLFNSKLNSDHMFILFIHTGQLASVFVYDRISELLNKRIREVW